MRLVGGTIFVGAMFALLGAVCVGADPSAASPPQSAQARNAFRFDGPMIQGGTVLGTVPALTSGLTLDGRALPVAGDGRFLIAFDRDPGARAELRATRVDGSAVRSTLSIQPRAWRIERIDRLPLSSRPSAEFQLRRPGELAQINAARAKSHDIHGWRQ